MKRYGRILMFMLCSSLVRGFLQGGCASQAAQADTQSAAPEPLPAPPPQQSTQELEQLGAPIALYPDPFVAHILPTATHPPQVFEPDRSLHPHPNIIRLAPARPADTQSCAPSVTAL